MWGGYGWSVEGGYAKAVGVAKESEVCSVGIFPDLNSEIRTPVPVLYLAKVIRENLGKEVGKGKVSVIDVLGSLPAL